jgi:hypothetical protein
MRPTLVALMLAALVAMGSSRIATPVAASPVASEVSAPTETDIIKWSFTQGALTLLLVLTLISYRRDFFRKIEAKQSEIDLLREEKRMLRDVIDRNADAMREQAVALSANTKATEHLAQNINHLAERRAGHR